MGTETQKQGFTLVELLVVVAIIAILSSLLLSAISKAKSKGQATICLNNHRQLALAWQLYVNDNRDELPQNSFNCAYWRSLDPTMENWAAGQLSWEDNWTDNTNANLLVPGLNGSIGLYSGNASIYKCPSDRSETSFNGILKPRVRSVMMNEYLSDTEAIKAGYKLAEWNAGFASTIFFSISDFQTVSTADLFVFIDAHEDCVRDTSFMVRYHSAEPWTGDLPSTRHGRSGAISFADGHAQTKRWNALTYKPVERIFWIDQQQQKRPAAGNSDPEWLYEHATYPSETYQR